MWMGGTIKSERSLINNDLIPWGNYPVNELHSGGQEAAPFWIPVAHDLSVSLSRKHALKNLTAKYGTSKVKIIQIIKNDVIVFVVHSFLMIKSMLLAVFGIFFFFTHNPRNRRPGMPWPPPRPEAAAILREGTLTLHYTVIIMFKMRNLYFQFSSIT